MIRVAYLLIKLDASCGNDLLCVFSAATVLVVGCFVICEGNLTERTTSFEAKKIACGATAMRQQYKNFKSLHFAI